MEETRVLDMVYHFRVICVLERGGGGPVVDLSEIQDCTSDDVYREP